VPGYRLLENSPGCILFSGRGRGICALRMQQAHANPNWNAEARPPKPSRTTHGGLNFRWLAVGFNVATKPSSDGNLGLVGLPGRHAKRAACMGVYDFEVLKVGAVIAAEQTIALPDTSAAWPKIAELANTFDQPGYKIRVKDEAGGIVILIGVATLRRSINAVSSGTFQHLRLAVSGAISEAR
jgi:hypothetical protein